MKRKTVQSVFVLILIITSIFVIALDKDDLTIPKTRYYDVLIEAETLLNPWNSDRCQADKASCKKTLASVYPLLDKADDYRNEIQKILDSSVPPIQADEKVLSYDSDLEKLRKKVATLKKICNRTGGHHNGIDVNCSSKGNCPANKKVEFDASASSESFFAYPLSLRAFSLVVNPEALPDQGELTLDNLKKLFLDSLVEKGDEKTVEFWAGVFTNQDAKKILDLLSTDTDKDRWEVAIGNLNNALEAETHKRYERYIKFIQDDLDTNRGQLKSEYYSIALLDFEDLMVRERMANALIAWGKASQDPNLFKDILSLRGVEWELVKANESVEINAIDKLSVVDRYYLKSGALLVDIRQIQKVTLKKYRDLPIPPPDRAP